MLHLRRWGNILSITGTRADNLGILNPLRYRGYVYDQDTGLYYLQSRYYDPQWGRFLNADAFVSTGQGLLGNNMFAYCRNNSVKRKDVTGTEDICVTDDDDGNPLNDLGEIGGSAGGASGGGYTSGSSHGSSHSLATTTLYRSVGDSETADLAKTGRFRTTDRSMACKQFGFDYNEVAHFGEKVGNEHIVSVTIPSDSISKFCKITVDATIFRHGTLTVYEELLDLFNELIKDTIMFLK